MNARDKAYVAGYRAVVEKGIKDFGEARDACPWPAIRGTRETVGFLSRRKAWLRGALWALGMAQ